MNEASKTFWFGVKVGMVIGFVCCLITSLVVFLPIIHK